MGARRSVAVASLVVCASACTSYRNVQPAQFIPQHNPDTVLVWTRDGEVTDLIGPRVDGDTLKGRVAGLSEVFAHPLNDIVTVQARGPDKRKTAFLVAGGVLVGGFLIDRIATTTTGSSTLGQAGVSPCLQAERRDNEC